MNQTYRLVWSHAQRGWVVASELSRSAKKGKGKALTSSRLWSALFLAAASLLTAQANAANCVVSNEAELRQAIISANADGDVTSSITLTANIVIADSTAFATATKPLTIDTAGFNLSAVRASTTGAGIDLTFVGGPLVTTGAFTGGSARNVSSAGAGGAGLKLTDGTLDNSGVVTGGRGGFHASTGSGNSGAGGAGARLTNSDLLNRGTLRGGDGGQYDANNGTGSGGTRVAGSGGAGLVMVGGSLDNQGTIQGGVGGSFIRLPTSGDNSYGGVGGIGASLSGGAHFNSGSIVGGIGGAGANQGGSSGSYPGGAGLVLQSNASLVNVVTGSITGGNGVNTIGSSPASSGGVGASVNNSTLENYGTITGGSSGGSTINGGIGLTGTGNAIVINDGNIVGGTRSNGTVNNSAVSFAGGGNRLELRSNSSITGKVLGGATDILAFGGSVDAGFNASQIGPAAQYRNFGIYQKRDSSTWTLTGATTAVTPWTLLGGVLSVSADGNLGSTAGRLTFDDGTLEVTGNTYNGTSRLITVSSGGGRIDIDDASNVFATSSLIDGSGALTKLGDGTLLFAADNTYSGGTTISAGTLQLGNGGTAGNIASGTLVNNSALTINRSNDMTLAGAISGSGSLSQLGAGVTTLGGINTYSGGTTISAGTLQGSATSFGTVAILNNSALVLDQVSDGTLGNLISGSGSVTKQGSGALALTAANSYAGATSVNAGTLYINNHQSAAGLTTVQTGGTLGGTGAIGGSVIVNDGTLAPGAGGVGVLSILGGLTLDASSVLSFELGAPNILGGAFNDLLQVQGNLTLDGTLNVAASAGGNYGPGFYRLIDYRYGAQMVGRRQRGSQRSS